MSSSPASISAVRTRTVSADSAGSLKNSSDPSTVSQIPDAHPDHPRGPAVAAVHKVIRLFVWDPHQPPHAGMGAEGAPAERPGRISKAGHRAAVLFNEMMSIRFLRRLMDIRIPGCCIYLLIIGAVCQGIIFGLPDTPVPVPPFSLSASSPAGMIRQGRFNLISTKLVYSQKGILP